MFNSRRLANIGFVIAAYFLVTFIYEFNANSWYAPPILPEFKKALNAKPRRWKEKRARNKIINQREKELQYYHDKRIEFTTTWLLSDYELKGYFKNHPLTSTFLFAKYLLILIGAVVIWLHIRAGMWVSLLGCICFVIIHPWIFAESHYYPIGLVYSNYYLEPQFILFSVLTFLWGGVLILKLN